MRSYVLILAEEAEGPFPWAIPRPSPPNIARKGMEATPAESEKLHPHTDAATLHPEIAGKVTALMAESLALETITWKLPRKNLSAGTVLQHAVRTIERYFEQYNPCIWKIGWTHDPIWRWGNNLYGYGVGQEKWEQMVIIFASHEPHGPAFLESALIEKYKSFLVLSP